MPKRYHLPLQLPVVAYEEFDEEPVVFVDDDIDTFLERTREEVHDLSVLQARRDETPGCRRRRWSAPFQV